MEWTVGLGKYNHYLELFNKLLLKLGIHCQYEVIEIERKKKQVSKNHNKI